MTTYTGHIRISTEGDGDVQPLTDRVAALVREAGVERGVAVVFVPGATAAVTTMEFEPGGVNDLRVTLDKLVPSTLDYAPGGSAPYIGPSGPHTPELDAMRTTPAGIKAAILGPSESIPVDAGRLLLGTWQQIVLVDFDDRARERTVLVSVLS